jgi:hypothetical protein
MEDVYVKWGEGEESVLMWGLSPYDNNNQITTYKAQYGLSNPCAGTEGNAPATIQQVIDGQQFFGYPTYAVVCPDKKLTFNVCFPPSVDCFDPIIMNCMPSAIGDEVSDDELIEIFPNPVIDYANLQLNFAGKAKIEMINLLGSVVYTNDLYSTGQLNEVVFVGNLPDGMYVLYVQADQQTYSRKLTIRR